MQQAGTFEQITIPPCCVYVLRTEPALILSRLKWQQICHLSAVTSL